MDVIFKFGEHYYNSQDNSNWIQLLMTVFGAFLGFGSALYFYYKKLKRESTEQKLKLEKENKNKLKYSVLLLENIVNVTKNEIKSIENFKTLQERDLLNIIRPRKYVSNDFKRLVLINKEIFEAYNYFNTDNDWLDKIKKLHIILDFIEGTFNEIEQISTNHLKNSYSNILFVKEKIELIPDKLSALAFHLQNKYGDERWKNELYVFVNDTIIKYGELVDNNSDLNKLNKEFLEPMLTEILEKYKNESELVEIIFLAKNARVKMNDIKNDVNHFVSELELIKKALVSSLENLEKQSKELNNVL